MAELAQGSAQDRNLDVMEGDKVTNSLALQLGGGGPGREGSVRLPCHRCGGVDGGTPRGHADRTAGAVLWSRPPRRVLARALSALYADPRSPGDDTSRRPRF